MYFKFFLCARHIQTQKTFIDISKSEQAALFTLLSTIFPKENVPPPHLLLTTLICNIYILPSLISLQFFHFSSRAFPPLDGQFTGRIRWQGSPARGDASISLINSTLKDNGTYTCSVRNPPDVHGAPNSHTVLTVTPKGELEHMHMFKNNQAGPIVSCRVFLFYFLIWTYMYILPTAAVVCTK